MTTLLDLIDTPPPTPTWHHCRYGQCTAPVVAVTVTGTPLCADHYPLVDELYGPTLRPRPIEVP